MDNGEGEPGDTSGWLGSAQAVSLPESVRREAQIVGLDDIHAPSLEAIEQRRYRLWVFTVIMLGVVTMGVLVLPLLPQGQELPSPTILRVLVFTLALGFVIYALDREVHLRRLISMLVDERVLTASLTNRVRELASMLDAGKAVNSMLDLDRVLHQILASSLDLLEADNGSIMLVEGDELRVVCARGDSATLGATVKLGEGVAGRVAETGEPLLVLGHVDPAKVKGATRRTHPVASAMSVPLVHRDRLLGVLNVNAGADRPFTEYDLRAVSLFGEQAASAVANARLYESQRAQAAALAHQAFHDPLTDLANRVLFFERLDDVLRDPTGLRSSDRRGMALLFIDLDDFKRINDTFGHQVGDELLVAVAERLSTMLREGDIAARLGGDEFAVLLDGTRRPEDALAFSERLVARISEPLELHGHRMTVGASVGIAMAEPGSATSETLMRNADAALYRAKGLGRRMCQVFEAHMLLADPSGIEMEADLQRAVDRDELEVHYQPIHDIVGDRVVMVEALVRWRHPERGLVQAGDFLPLATDTGLIVPISRWVLEEATRQLGEWRRSGLAGDLSVCVNIAGAHFRRADLIADVQAALSRSGLAEDRLVLEIDEEDLMRDGQATLAQLDALRRLGVEVAVDDFGTGYSSLSHLRALPLSILKIDRSFIEGIVEDQVQAGFVRSVVDMSAHLGLKLVAEGVETEAQRNLLLAVGCRLAQGFCFSPALEPAQLTRRLQRSRATVD